MVASAEPAPDQIMMDLPADQVFSAFEYLTESSRDLQQDSFANPGYLWVERGDKLFHGKGKRVNPATTQEQPQGYAEPCSSCHQADALVGAATRYPAIDEQSGKLVNLEARINLCRRRYQQLPALGYESEVLLSLTAWIASLSKGLPYVMGRHRVGRGGEASPGNAMNKIDAKSLDASNGRKDERQVNIGSDGVVAEVIGLDTRLAQHLAEGRQYYFQRRGQMNLACHHCHDRNWGKMLRGDRISQGHGNAFPAYRLEWQTLGSLHRRLRDCDAGVRAEPHEAGSATYTSLELYLAWRAAQLPLESPGVRR